MEETVVEKDNKVYGKRSFIKVKGSALLLTLCTY